MSTQKLVQTGVNGLDEILNGGLPSDRLYLVDGDPGAGKTTLGLQFLMAGVANDEKVLYVTLSETKKEVEAVAHSHGWDISKIAIFELRSATELEVDNQNTFFHPSEIELGETTKAILDVVKKINPSRVVFDSLSELRLLARESLRYRRQILALKQYFVGKNTTVLLLDDRTSDVGDLDLHSLVHGVIRLEQLAPEYGANRRRMRILKLRGVSFRGGYHDFVLKRGGILIFPRLVASDHETTTETSLLKSGVSQLDQLLGGGIDRGSSTLLMGPAGAGKSTVALQYASAAAKNGEKAAIFSFDEGKRSLLKRAQSMGIDVASYIEKGTITLQQIDPAELSPGEFVSLVCDAVEKQNARVVIIDSLNGYINAMPEERFLIIQMHELLSYLNQRGVATFMIVAQHGLIGSNMNSPVDVSYLADTVLLMRFFESAGEVHKAISTLKRRSGVHEKSIREITFSNKGIQVGEPLKHFRGILTGVPDFVRNEPPESRF
ncbi:ATPase domain-containing protein [Bdellovibrio sp. KM01]|uniref:ATPase domain-containing protein n=1 Tax=Bdellovibrio sp. KM01 TaxID=2748865 RepID=UPI0015EAE399|nr:ATPase domain-containing protein [Bdellovibrio sp. KM01]QLY26425.1 AAA family ATPase [Bdellovibrio sp. KM01]